ncbi:MAG: TonB-dependent receptor family protein [Ignavibacterium sp.]|nr:TonB-dependent receptor family protein [Ignavibacterium sp.]
MFRYLFTVLLLAFTVNAQQSTPLEGKTINGIIIDSLSNSGLPFANITLHNSTDSSFITGVSSSSDGTFRLTNLSDGKYYLKISFVGYNTKFVPSIHLSDNKQKVDLGKISLTKTAYEITGAEVIGEKVGEELHLDKKVINVSQNLNTQGQTALDVLENQPSVRVDPDGTVYLRGSSSFTVLVNNKPYPLQGADALKQISANSIENIELITNPSSKYDAEGSAGIININLKVQKDLSMSAIVNLNSGTGDKYNGDLSFSYNADGWNLTTGFDYRNNTFTNEQDIRRNSVINNQDLYDRSDVNIRNKRRQYSFRAGADYTPDNQNNLGLSVGIGFVDVVSSLNSRVTNLGTSLSNYSRINNIQDIPVGFINSTFTYQYKFIPNESDIYLELTHNYVTVDNEQKTIENQTDPSFSSVADMLSNTIFTNNSVRNDGRAKLNYTHKFDDITKLEAGLQSNLAYRDFNLNNKIFNESINDFDIDPALTNKFNLRNNVYAGFVSFSSEFAGFDYMLGLRGEYMDRYLDQKTTSSAYSFTKMDYFPSVNISRKIDDHQLQLSYSRRINRPNENLLNPFPFYSDPSITISGNPRLMPEYIDALELNYQKMYGSVFVSVQTYYRKSKDSFSQTFSVDTSGTLNIVFDNYGNSDVYGAEISSSFSVAEFLKLDPSINLFRNHIDGKVNGAGVEKDFFNWSARLNSTLSFSPDTRLMFSVNTMKFVDAQSESNLFAFITASFRRDFFDKAMSLTLQARNLFGAADFNIRTIGSNFTGNALIMPESPVVTLLFSYNFNNFKKSQRPNDNIDVPTGL